MQRWMVLLSAYQAWRVVQMASGCLPTHHRTAASFEYHRILTAKVRRPICLPGMMSPEHEVLRGALNFGRRSLLLLHPQGSRRCTIADVDLHVERIVID